MSRAQRGDRRWFSSLGETIYWSHSAISPPSDPLRAAVAAALDDYAREGIGAWARWREQRDRLRGKLGTLVDADASTLAFVTNTTFGIQAIAACKRWRPGDEIVCFTGEFPTNVTPWQAVAPSFDLQVRMLPVVDYAAGAERGLDALEQVLRSGRVGLVAVSLVQFQNGLRMPVEEMADLCHRYGAELFVDAIQGIGVVPFRVGAADYVVCGGHKWLMGLEGTGFLYAAPERAAALEPRLAGWLSHEDAVGFLFEGEGHLRYDRPIRPQIDFLEAGAQNVTGLCGAGDRGGFTARAGCRQHLQPRPIDPRSRRSRTARTWLHLAAQPRHQRPLWHPRSPTARAVDRPQPRTSPSASRRRRHPLPTASSALPPHWPNDEAQVGEFFTRLDGIEA